MCHHPWSVGGDVGDDCPMAGVFSLEARPIAGSLRAGGVLMRTRVLLNPAIPLEVRGQRHWSIEHASEEGGAALGGGVYLAVGRGSLVGGFMDNWGGCDQWWCACFAHAVFSATGTLSLRDSVWRICGGW